MRVLDVRPDDEPKTEYEAPWHSVWNRLRRPAVKEPGFFGMVLRGFRQMRESPLRRALAEVVWWDLAELKCDCVPERIMAEIQGYRMKEKEKVPPFTVAEEELMRQKLEDMGWVFGSRVRSARLEAAMAKRRAKAEAKAAKEAAKKARAEAKAAAREAAREAAMSALEEAKYEREQEKEEERARAVWAAHGLEEAQA